MIRPASGLVAVPLVMIAMAIPAAAQPLSRPAVLPVDSLAWLSGHWLSCDDLVHHEGVWMGPSGGTMTGAFRTSEGDTVVRYEMFLIEQSSAGPVLSRRTFGRSLASGADAEQWTRLRLREASGMRAMFSPSTHTNSFSVTFERTGEDHLRVSVGRTRDGKCSTESIEYSRQQQ